jgi:hypothetical protein
MAGAGDNDVGGGDDAGGGLVGTGGNAAAAFVLNEALPSGLWVARRKAEATAHSAMTPMSVTESHPLADFALAGMAVACDAPEERPSSHVATT